MACNVGQTGFAIILKVTSLQVVACILMELHDKKKLGGKLPTMLTMCVNVDYVCQC